MTGIVSNIWDIAQGTTRLRSGISVSVMFILNIIFLWKIFEMRGQGGWKALIPFYSDYTFGVVAKEKKLGKKLVLAEVLSIVSGLALGVFLLVMLSATRRMYDPISGDFSRRESAPVWLTVVVIALSVLLVWMIVSMIVWRIKLYHRFVLLNRAPGWMTLIFVFIPTLALGYFAFIRGTNNDPFPPTLHNG